MVKVTREEIECDLCNKPGERFTISYPDGIKVIDRCPTHAKKVLALRDEPGSWSTLGSPSRARLRVMTADEINAQRSQK